MLTPRPRCRPEGGCSHNRQIYAISRIRFALATATSLEHEPFTRLEDFQAWLEEQWPYREPKPPARYDHAETPQTLRRARGDEKWSDEVLRASIAEAAKGRAPAAAVSELAGEVTNTVRDALRGQVIVTSEQVATEVMRTLRERDPLTYLWYASVHKHFRNAMEMWQEVEGLKEDGR